MAILDIFIPGRAKANLSTNLAVVKGLAVSQGGKSGLLDERMALWEACCDGAADLVTQLFIGNWEKQINWGLKKRRRKLNQPRLTAIYWWMLLYQLVILRNRGLQGLDKDEEFDSLRGVAFDFMEGLASSPDNTVQNPGPWERNWERQVPLEAALAIYDRIVQVLGLRVDFEARIARVSLFTSASEKAYDVNIAEPIARRLGGD